MLAAARGQIWNASALGQSLGLSYHTVNSYLDFLDGSYLIGRLSPWSGNLRKRLTKSPEVCIRDSGLLYALLRIASRTELLRHPVAGASWEGFVIDQVLGTLGAHGIQPDPTFLRTSDGHEIDLLLRVNATVIAIEIKLAPSVAPQDLARLERLADVVGAEHRDLVCQTPAPTADARRGVLSLDTLLERLLRLAMVSTRSWCSTRRRRRRWASGSRRRRCCARMT